MKITIVLDTDKETVEDLKRLQKGIDELIGKKLGVTSEEQPEAPKPQLQTIEPERDPQPSSTGFPTQPEEQQFSASSPHEIIEKVQEQSNQQPPQQEPRGWPNKPEQPKEEPKKTESGEKSLELEDINDAMSKLYSGR
jgi:hypothetical protein